MSKIKKVQGSSVQEAVKIATAMYGDDISIIETKSIKGVFGKAKGYEVIVSLPEAEEEEFHREERKSRFQNHLQSKYGGGESKREFKNDGGVSVQFGNSKPKRKYSLLDEEEEEVPEKVEKPKARSSESIDVSANAKKIMELAKKRQMEANGEKFVADEVAPKRVRKESSSEENYYKDIKSEIGQLNDKIKLIQNMFWEEKHPETTISTTIPPEFSEIYKITKQSGMNLEHLDKIMNLSIQHMPLKMRGNSETVKRYFKALLRKMIPIRQESFIKRPNKKIIMFVGSTGVGKTTTIAKLAARLTFQRKENFRVGFLVLDTYKIGALEQLTQYARMMKLQIDTVTSATDFAEKLDEMSNNDYIFIDTMGSSPYDVEKIEMLKEYLDKGNYVHEIEVTMVLPSSLKFEDLKEGYNSFSKLNIDTIIFTKLDETKGFGNIFSLIHDIQKPISYFSIGQEVPEDIIVAKSDYLVDSLLNGFKRK